MLTKGLKDEKQRQLNQILNAGLQLAFVPELWNLEEKRRVDEILQQTLNVPLSDLVAMPLEDLLQVLEREKFSFSNMESLADLLLKTATVEQASQSVLAKKALAIYDFAQVQSKTFSFTILEKSQKAQKLI